MADQKAQIVSQKQSTDQEIKAEKKKAEVAEAELKTAMIKIATLEEEAKKKVAAKVLKSKKFVPNMLHGSITRKFAFPDMASPIEQLEALQLKEIKMQWLYYLTSLEFLYEDGKKHGVTCSAGWSKGTV